MNLTQPSSSQQSQQQNFLPVVLIWGDVEIGGPKYGEVKVTNKATGLNFCDIYIRRDDKKKRQKLKNVPKQKKFLILSPKEQEGPYKKVTNLMKKHKLHAVGRIGKGHDDSNYGRSLFDDTTTTALNW